MKIWTTIMTLTFLTACGKPDPTYNPFDSLFDIDVLRITANNCDTISAGCGYFNLTHYEDDHEVYYQIYMDEKEVLAKGLVIPLDTFVLDTFPTKDNEDSLDNAVFTNPVDTVRVDNILASYGLTRLDKTGGQANNLWLYQDDKNEQYELNLDRDWQSEKLTIIRLLNYYESRERKK